MQRLFKCALFDKRMFLFRGASKGAVIMILANDATYRKLSTFQSVDELNESIKAHKSAHDLTDTERAVLDLISQYACKYPGVCYLSKNKIGDAVSRVRRTVIRVCQRLEALGIIKQYETKRDGGDWRQSSNVIVVMPVEQVVEQSVRNTDSAQPNEVTPDMSRHKAPSKKLNNIIKDNTYASASPSGSSQPFYARFKALIHSTIGNGSQRLISRFFGVYKAHSTPLLRRQAFDKQDVEQVGWQALIVMIQATKHKRIRNVVGYYNGVLDRMLDRLFFEEIDAISQLT